MLSKTTPLLPTARVRITLHWYDWLICIHGAWFEDNIPTLLGHFLILTNLECGIHYCLSYIIVTNEENIAVQ